MSRETFDRLRVPLALGIVLLLLAGYLVLRRAEADSTATDPIPSIVVGEPGGGVWTPSPSATLAPSASPSAQPTSSPTVTPSLTPTATPSPSPDVEFTAAVMACRSISEAECNDEIRTLGSDDETFVALVLFNGAIAGDVMNAILDGPSGPIEGGAYALPGSGRGYYYSTFAVSGLPSGDYTLTALRNGDEVATTELRKRGDG